MRKYLNQMFSVNKLVTAQPKDKELKSSFEVASPKPKNEAKKDKTKELVKL